VLIAAGSWSKTALISFLMLVINPIKSIST
jgi:hypothetical protein